MKLSLPEDMLACPKSRINAQLELEDFRIERLAEVVNPARLVSPSNMRVLGINGSDKDDWHVFAGVKLLYRRSGLESIHARHLHVEQNHVDMRMLRNDG